MAKIHGIAYHNGMLYYENKKGEIVPATFPDSPTRLLLEA